MFFCCYWPSPLQLNNTHVVIIIKDVEYPEHQTVIIILDRLIDTQNVYHLRLQLIYDIDEVNRNLVDNETSSL